MLPIRSPIRLIPRLDVKGPNLVKGIHLEGLRVLGDPSIFAHRYARDGADELLFMDAVASLYGRNGLLDVVSKTARDVFIPLTVGGGLRTLDDIALALKAGADKIAINTAAIENPDFVSRAAQRFGSSTVVVHIDAKRERTGRWTAWIENGREPTRHDAVEWAKQAAQLGCGEIIITSIDREGTTKGFDTDLCTAVSECVDVPVIVCGGAGSPNDVVVAAASCDLAAISLASILHYGIAAELESEGYQFGAAGEFKVIAEQRHFSRVNPSSIMEVKAALDQAGFAVRSTQGSQQ